MGPGRAERICAPTHPPISTAPLTLLLPRERAAKTHTSFFPFCTETTAPRFPPPLGSVPVSSDTFSPVRAGNKNTEDQRPQLRPAARPATRGPHAPKTPPTALAGCFRRCLSEEHETHAPPCLPCPGPWRSSAQDAAGGASGSAANSPPAYAPQAWRTPATSVAWGPEDSEAVSQRPAGSRQGAFRLLGGRRGWSLCGRRHVCERDLRGAAGLLGRRAGHPRGERRPPPLPSSALRRPSPAGGGKPAGWVASPPGPPRAEPAPPRPAAGSRPQVRVSAARPPECPSSSFTHLLPSQAPLALWTENARCVRVLRVS